MKKVAITGIGVISPLGNSYSTFKENLRKGKSGAGLVTRFDTSGFKTKIACEVKDFEPEKYIPKKEVRRLDLFSQFALNAVGEAIDHADINFDRLESEMAGVIWGSGIGGLRSLEAEIEYNVGRDEARYNPFMIPKMIADIAAGHISMKYGLTGINYATLSACASSNHAIINAIDYIRLGKANLMVVGGSEAAVTRAGIGGFSGMKALSLRNDAPEKASRPFDSERDGFVLGEGAAALIVESYEHAKARGANIIAELGGGGMTADAHHMTAPHPEGEGAKRAMELALKDAQMDVSEIDYINVHGTSTPLGDVAEIKAIEKVFTDHIYNLSISSTKSMTGHLLGAAGAIECAAAIAAIEEQFVPPTINLDNLDENIDPKLDLCPNVAKERQINAVLSNTFGFGGHNASVIIKKA